MLSEDNRAQAEQMWAQGATAKEIAKALGSTSQFAGTMITKARRRGWNLPHRRPDMVDRGRTAIKALKAKPANTRKRRLGIDISQLDELGKQAACERMWAEGYTSREIAENMGWGGTSNPGSYITKARRRGWNLPYRNPGGVRIARARMKDSNLRRYGVDDK